MCKTKKNSGYYGSIFHLLEMMEEREEKARLKAEKIKSGGIRHRVTTPAQATQRMRFSIIGKFIGKIKDAVKIGLDDKFKSSVATAIQLNSKQAIIGEYRM